MTTPAAIVAVLAAALFAGKAGPRLAAPAGAEETGALPSGPYACLHGQAADQAMAAHKLVAPIQALRVVRGAERGGKLEPLGVHLCMAAERPVYIVTSLRADGRVVRVMIDGVSGRWLGAR